MEMKHHEFLTSGLYGGSFQALTDFILEKVQTDAT
jgi:hypothetical protein